MTKDDETDEADGELGSGEDFAAVEQLLFDIAEAEAQDFEHRRVLTVVRKKLLGTDSPLHIDGRYQVIRRLGGGGMGEVYLCDDGDLHRQVAVKFVRGLGNSLDQARLRREAQTLGPLSHPNIVVVHDVGEHEGRTFLAMQYVEGQTLAQWLDVPRPWREVLARFLAAGRGLAAAHRAGVVHRDFKPANVLLGQDGEVKVADFGLALVEGRIDPHLEETLSSSGASPGSQSSVGSAAGTARYMSLEQLEGLSVDTRSDQFGFCLALYEALWGRPPFADSDIRARREALSRDQPMAPSGSHGLWRVIRRGLAREPDERWPSMGALLVALERVPRRRRLLARSTVGAAVFAVCFGLGLVAVESLGLRLVAGESGDVCEDVELGLDGVWNEDRRSELERHFDTLEAGHVADSSQRILVGLEQWRTTWLVERENVCRAQDERTEDRSALILRDQCLDRQRERVELIVDMLVDANAAMLAEAVVVIDELPEPASCADEHPERIEPPAPADAGRVAEVRKEITRAREQRQLGEIGHAHKTAEAANTAALEINYGPVQAEARAELAKAKDVAGLPSAELYDEAIDLAETHHHDRLVAQLWVERAELSLFDLIAAEQGKWELHRAVVAYERVGGADERARPRLHFGQGRIAELSGDLAAAKTSYGEAVALGREVQNADLLVYLDALARVVKSKDDALALRREAVEFVERHWGPVHPKLATVHLLLGGEAARRGELDIAETHARSMAAIQESELLGRNHPDRGEPEQLLATVESLRGNPEVALTHARVALELFERAGSNHPGAWSMRQLIVNQLLALGRLDDAETELGDMLAARPADPSRAASIHLQLTELAVRKHLLEDADLQLRTVATLGLDLGNDAFTYEFLRALVDLRLGRLERAQVSTPSPFNDAQLSTWFDELELTASEREQLALDQ